jgi:hypothetical protein
VLLVKISSERRDKLDTQNGSLVQIGSAEVSGYEGLGADAKAGILILSYLSSWKLCIAFRTSSTEPDSFIEVVSSVEAASSIESASSIEAASSADVASSEDVVSFVDSTSSAEVNSFIETARSVEAASWEDVPDSAAEGESEEEATLGDLFQVNQQQTHITSQ